MSEINDGDDLLLTAFLDGELGPEAAAALAQRLDTDPILRERRAAILRLTAALKEQLPTAPEHLDRARRSALIAQAFDGFTPQPRHLRWLGIRQAAVACLIAAILIGLLMPSMTPLMERRGRSLAEQDDAPTQVTGLTPAPITMPNYGYTSETKTTTIDGPREVEVESPMPSPVIELDIPVEEFNREEADEYAGAKGREEVTITAEISAGGVFIPSDSAGSSAQRRSRDKQLGKDEKTVPGSLAAGEPREDRDHAFHQRQAAADNNAGQKNKKDAAEGGRKESLARTDKSLQEAQLLPSGSGGNSDRLRNGPAKPTAPEPLPTTPPQPYPGWSADLAPADLARSNGLEVEMADDGMAVSDALDQFRDLDDPLAVTHLEMLDESTGEPKVSIDHLDFSLPTGQNVLHIARAAGLQMRPALDRIDVIASREALDPLDRFGLDDDAFRAAFATAPMQVIADTAAMTVAITADTASFDASEQRLAQGQVINPADIRAEHFVNAVPSGYPAPSGDEAFALYAEAGPAPFAAGPHAKRTALVSLGAVARSVAPDERRPLHLTLAIDRSGSMAGAAGIDRVRAGLAELVPQLRADDRVAIVAFADRAELLLPATPGDQTADILATLDRLQAGGGTNAVEGLALAYQVAAEASGPGIESRVVLATDGAALVGDSATVVLERINADRGRGITLLVMGCGGAQSQDQTLDTLAARGDGQHVFVGSDDAARTLFRDRLLPERLGVLARDAKLQMTWNPERVSHARLIGFEQRRLANEDFRNDAVDAGEIGHDTQVTALFEVILTEGGSGPLGTASVRYRDTRVDAVRELSCPLPGRILASSPSPRLHLQACAAQLAELLARSWWANQRAATYAQLLHELRRLPQSAFRDRLLVMAERACLATREP